MKFYWICGNEDNRHGCFNADWDGRCEARSRKSFDSEEKARIAAAKHQKICKWRRWQQGVTVYGEKI